MKVQAVVRGVKRKKRLSRLLEMVFLIQARGDWRPGRLAEHFGVSETRIYEDIRELAAAGVPVYFSGGGYKMAGETVLSSTSLSPEEVLDLLYPGHLFAEDGMPAASETLLAAKLASCLPVAVRSQLTGELGRGRIRVESGTVRGMVLRRLHDAVAQHRRVEIRYASRASGRTTDREVDPYALIFRRHSWYLIARCHTRAEVRKFRLSRIRSVVPTALHFSVPRDFSLEEYTRGWWEVFGGEPVHVAVRFARRVADLIRERAPRPGQTIQELPGGAVIYRVTVCGVREIGWWIMQYGADAEVVEPEVLRNLLRSNAERMVSIYSRAPAVEALQPVKVAETLEPYEAGGP